PGRANPPGRLRARAGPCRQRARPHRSVRRVGERGVRGARRAAAAGRAGLGPAVVAHDYLAPRRTAGHEGVPARGRAESGIVGAPAGDIMRMNRTLGAALVFALGLAAGGGLTTAIAQKRTLP